jgi:hypothetical protein
MFSERENLLRISLSTLIEVCTLLGHKLEDRSQIRLGQNEELLNYLMLSTCRLADVSIDLERFCFGSFDFLIYEQNGQRRFQLLEVNGTGMAGITNVPLFILDMVMMSLSKSVTNLTDPTPLVLVPYSGTVKLADSGTSQLIHERILYAQSIKQTFQKKYGQGQILALTNLDPEQPLLLTKPTVVMGFLKDLLPYCSVESGRLCFLGNPISAALHDQFCEYAITHFKNELGKNAFKALNHIFPIASDKGGAYEIYNDFLDKHSFHWIKDQADYSLCQDRQSLIDTVLAKRNEGIPVVIKPHAGGLGRGIEFFIDQEPDDIIVNKVDASIHAIEQYYGLEGGVFPYTVCRFIDSTVINKPDSPWHGHKYELRLFVFKDGQRLMAVPAIAKLASHKYDAASPNRAMLMNNIAFSKNENHTSSGTDYMLPLTNEDTLRLLDISTDQIKELCSFSTRFMTHVLESVPVHPLWRETASPQTVA